MPFTTTIKLVPKKTTEKEGFFCVEFIRQRGEFFIKFYLNDTALARSYFFGYFNKEKEFIESDGYWYYKKLNKYIWETRQNNELLIETVEIPFSLNQEILEYFIKDKRYVLSEINKESLIKLKDGNIDKNIIIRCDQARDRIPVGFDQISFGIENNKYFIKFGMEENLSSYFYLFDSEQLTPVDKKTYDWAFYAAEGRFYDKNMDDCISENRFELTLCTSSEQKMVALVENFLSDSNYALLSQDRKKLEDFSKALQANIETKKNERRERQPNGLFYTRASKQYKSEWDGVESSPKNESLNNISIITDRGRQWVYKQSGARKNTELEVAITHFAQVLLGVNRVPETVVCEKGSLRYGILSAYKKDFLSFYEILKSNKTSEARTLIEKYGLGAQYAAAFALADSDRHFFNAGNYSLDWGRGAFPVMWRYFSVSAEVARKMATLRRIKKGKKCSVFKSSTYPEETFLLDSDIPRSFPFLKDPPYNWLTCMPGFDIDLDIIVFSKFFRDEANTVFLTFMLLVDQNTPEHKNLFANEAKAMPMGDCKLRHAFIEYYTKRAIKMQEEFLASDYFCDFIVENSQIILKIIRQLSEYNNQFKSRPEFHYRQIDLMAIVSRYSDLVRKIYSARLRDEVLFEVAAYIADFKQGPSQALPFNAAASAAAQPLHQHNENSLESDPEKLCQTQYLGSSNILQLEKKETQNLFFYICANFSKVVAAQLKLLSDPDEMYPIYYKAVVLPLFDFLKQYLLKNHLARRSNGGVIFRDASGEYRVPHHVYQFLDTLETKKFEFDTFYKSTDNSMYAVGNMISYCDEIFKKINETLVAYAKDALKPKTVFFITIPEILRPRSDATTELYEGLSKRLQPK